MGTWAEPRRWRSIGLHYAVFQLCARGTPGFRPVLSLGTLPAATAAPRWCQVSMHQAWSAPATSMRQTMATRFLCYDWNPARCNAAYGQSRSAFGAEARHTCLAQGLPGQASLQLDSIPTAATILSVRLDKPPTFCAHAANNSSSPHMSLHTLFSAQAHINLGRQASLGKP